MPVHSWREKFKRQWFVREPAEVVFGKVEEKKKNYVLTLHRFQHIPDKILVIYLL